MPLDLSLPPRKVFHMPGLSTGMGYAGPRPGWVVRPAKKAEVIMVAGSDNDDLLAAQSATIGNQQMRLMADVLELRSSPVVLTNAEFKKDFVTIDNQIWLNGASGTRMRRKFAKANDEAWRMDRLSSAFRWARRNSSGLIPKGGEIGPEVPAALELRNGMNYYHFTVETLGGLAHFLGSEGDFPIHIHLPKGEVRGFVMGFIEAVFPSLAHRVQLVQKSRRYPVVRSVYSHKHYLYQVGDQALAAALGDEALDPRWSQLSRDPFRIAIAAMSSFDSSLRMLRQQALRHAKKGMSGTMPRLIWMGRDERPGTARTRGMTGHEALLEELRARGFEVVAFENLTPIEQISAANSADVIVAPHGAGIANMLYARPGALIVEIANRQSQMHRWGDFLPCAHAAKSRYATVFADVAGFDGSAVVPPIKDGLLGIHVGRRATDQIISLIDEHLHPKT